MIALLIALLVGCPWYSIEDTRPGPAFGLVCVYDNYTLTGVTR